MDRTGKGKIWAKLALVAGVVLFGSALAVQEGKKAIDGYRRELGKPSHLFMSVDWQEISCEDISREAGAAGGGLDAGMARRIKLAALRSLPVEPLAVTAARALSDVVTYVKNSTVSVGGGNGTLVGNHGHHARRAEVGA